MFVAQKCADWLGCGQRTNGEPAMGSKETVNSNGTPSAGYYREQLSFSCLSVQHYPVFTSLLWTCRSFNLPFILHSSLHLLFTITVVVQIFLLYMYGCKCAFPPVSLLPWRSSTSSFTCSHALPHCPVCQSDNGPVFQPAAALHSCLSRETNAKIIRLWITGVQTWFRLWYTNNIQHFKVTSVTWFLATISGWKVFFCVTDFLWNAPVWSIELFIDTTSSSASIQGRYCTVVKYNKYG